MTFIYKGCPVVEEDLESSTRNLTTIIKAYKLMLKMILDMIMPGKGGEETFRELKGIKSDVRVMLASGYTIDGVAEKMME